MTRKPNVVLVFTDNQQASTLGCYGNEEIYSPHLDKMAADGMVFDNAFCPNAFCSPCRASLLTGLLPSQHGVHSWIDDRRSQEWPDGWHILNGMRTLPELLQEDGYSTALVGKYHLGEAHSAMDGFDHWVTLEDGHIRSFYRNKMNENGRVFDHEGHTVDFFTDKALEFVEREAAAENPFFLYLPYPAPYGHWPATKETDTCRHTDLYADCPMESIPRTGLSKAAVDGFLRLNKNSGGGLDLSMLMRAPNDLGTLRNYYAQISMVDEGVGRIIEKLDALGIADDTVVIFTADHGLSTGQHGFWGHGAATYPSNMHHAAHSIPLIVRHGPKIDAGSRSKAMVSNMDLFSTVLDYCGLGSIDAEQDTPSRSLMPLLTGDMTAWEEDAVYSEQEETRVIRTPKWAYFKRFASETTDEFSDELYDVELDPGETNNLVSDPQFGDVRRSLDHMLEAFFERYTRQEADLWQGGKPIQNSGRTALWNAAWGEDWSPVLSYDET